MWVIAIMLLSTPPRFGLVNTDGAILAFPDQAECEKAIPLVAPPLQAQLSDKFMLKCVERTEAVPSPVRSLKGDWTSNAGMGAGTEEAGTIAPARDGMTS